MSCEKRIAMRKIKSLNYNRIFVIILTMQILNLLFWGAQKGGYYIDEMSSYGLSNGYYCPFLQDTEGYMNHWHEPSFYMNWLTTSEEDRFCYGSVYDNQANDVHPPFYYFLLHTICSLFPNIFSKWFGLLPNVIFFGLTVFCLFLLSKKLLGDNKLSLVPPLLYGFSVGGLSTAVYIRMYMMLTFWGILFLYLAVLLLEDKPKYLATFATVFAGGMTQYYFWILAFFATGTAAIWNLCRKKWKSTILFATTVLAGVVAGMLFFPASVTNLFFGTRTSEIVDNVNAGLRVFLRRMDVFLRIIGKELFLGKYGCYVLALALILGVVGSAFVLALKKDKKELLARCKVDWKVLWLCLLSAAGYFLVMVKISTDMVDRYFFSIYPLLFLLALAVFLCVGRIWKVKAGFVWGIAGVYLCVTFFLYGKGDIQYLYPGYDEALRQMQTEYSDAPALYVTKGNHLIANNCLFLAQQKRSMPIVPEGLEGITREELGSDSLILYVDIYYDEDATAQYATDLLEYDKVKLLYDNTFTQIYVLEEE